MYQHLAKGFNNRKAIEIIQAESDASPAYFKKHISLTLQGMARTLSLLEEFTVTLFNDIP